MEIGFRDQVHALLVGPIHPAVLGRLREWAGRHIQLALPEKFEMSFSDWVKTHKDAVLLAAMRDDALRVRAVLGEGAELPIVTNNMTLPADQDHVWITVNNVAVYIKRTDEGVGVVVNLHPAVGGDAECLASTWITFAEAAPDVEEGQPG